MIKNWLNNLLQVKGCVSIDVSCDNSFCLAPAVGVSTSTIRAPIDYTLSICVFISTIPGGAVPPTIITPVIGSLDSKLNLLAEHF